MARCCRCYKQPKDFDDDWTYEKDVNEQLGCYWECISGLDQKRWFTRETHQRKNLGIKFVTDKNYELLRSAKRGKKCISNICNYDVLTNIRYIDQLYYTQMGQRTENESSDMVVRLFYLGQPKVKVAHESSESDSEAMDTDERGDVRARIQTSKDMARHLAEAHT